MNTSTAPKPDTSKPLIYTRFLGPGGDEVEMLNPDKNNLASALAMGYTMEETTQIWLH